MCFSDLGESVLQWTDGIAGRVSRKADLLSLPERLGWNPVQVSVANPTSKTDEENKTEERLMVSFPPFSSSTVSPQLNRKTTLFWCVCLEINQKKSISSYLPSPPQALLGVMTTSLQLSVSVLYT